MYFNIILPSTPKCSKWSLSFRFPTKNLYTSLLSPIRVTCHVYLILLSFIIRITFCKKYKSLGPSLCSFPKHACTLSPLGPNIFLNTQFSNNLSQSSSLNVTDQVPRPHTHFNNILELFCTLKDRKLSKNFFSAWFRSVSLIIRLQIRGQFTFVFTAPSAQIISIGESIACSPKNLFLDDTAETSERSDKLPGVYWL